MGTRARRLPAALLALALCACGGSDAAPPQIVLITVDTLRADHLGAYGYERPTTPFLDELAARMTLFEDAVAQCGTTPQSLASLMTGRFPSGDRILVNNGSFVALRPGPPTLAGWLARQGYTTHGVTSQIQTTAVTGIDRGFLTFDAVDQAPLPGGNYARRTAKAVTNRAARWIDEHADERFFLWVHYFDPHWPYEPPPSHDSPMQALPPVEPGPKQPYRYDEMRNAAYPLDAADLQDILEGYDKEIRYLDGQIRRLFETIDALDDPLIVFTSDHGESLGEHGIVSHNDLYQSILRVPLMFGGRDVPRGLDVPEPVMLVDVAATVLDLAGLEPLPRTRGRSLRPLMEGGTLRERPRVAEYGESIRTVMWQGKKLILRGEDAPELFDLLADPDELSLLTDPALRERLLQASRTTPLPLPRAAGDYRLPAVTPEMEAELEALGYVGR